MSRSAIRTAGPGRCHSRWWGVLVVALMVVLPMAPPHGPADAAEATGRTEGEDGTEPPAFELLEARLPVVGDPEAGLEEWMTSSDTPAGVVLWPEGRRLYQFARHGSSGPPSVISAWDLDTFGEVARSDVLDPPVYPDTESHLLRPEQVAVDPARGVLFVPHGATTCLSSENSCLGGVHVLDGRTLEPVQDLASNPIRFQPIAVDGTMAGPRLQAATFVDDGSAGKLLLLVDEAVHRTPGGGGDHARRARTPHWLVQIDVASGTTDWVEPVRGCTSRRGDDSKISEAQQRNVLFRGATAIYVGCYISAGAGAVVKLDVDEDGSGGRPTGQRTIPGPGKVHRMHADPASERVLLMSMAGGDVVWWVFDGQVEGFVTTVGSGSGAGSSPSGRDFNTGRASGIDASTGRFYSLAAAREDDPAGLLHTDVRRTPVAQLSEEREFTAVTDDPEAHFEQDNQNPVVIDPATDGRPRRIFFRPGVTETPFYHVIVDRSTVASKVSSAEEILEAGSEEAPGTDEVDLDEHLTRVTFTGTARAYGLRSLLVGGAEAVYMNPVGPDNTATAKRGQTDPRGGDPCGERSRQFVFGVTGSLDRLSSVKPQSAIGLAQAAVTDDPTVDDLADPVARCAGGQFELAGEQFETFADLLRERGIRPPAFPPEQRPGVVWDFEQASCASSDRDARTTEDVRGDESMPASTFSSTVRCEDDRSTSGSSRARFLDAGPVAVAEAYSEFAVSRDDESGRTLAEARSYVRGLTILGPTPDGDDAEPSRVTIDLVETRATAWANGRTAELDAPEGCEDGAQEHGAGICLERTISGVTIVDGFTGETTSCEECVLSNDDLVAAMQQALGDRFIVRLREPDPILARGADNGTVAGIEKRQIDAAADAGLTGDLLPTLPGLELVRVNDTSEGRGRQVFQFAGVELSAVFTRQCLGVVEGEDCVAPPVPLAQLEVSLTDGLDGSPLAGGRFELAQTSAVSGATPLDSPVSCTTNATGRCELVALPAGSYTLTQTDAPGDYAPAEPLSLDLSPGSVFDVSVTNVREVGSVVAGLTDLDGMPLAGGMFELHADVEGDGTVGLDDPQVDVCTTGGDGTCTMADLPLGAYVLSQAAAPDGYAAVDDQVPFVLDAPGQTATIGYTNAPAASAASGASGSGSLGAVTELPPTQPVAVERPPGAEGPQVADPQASSALPRAPLPQQLAETWELLRRNPVQAAAFGLLLALAAAAVAGPMRRRLLLLTAG